MSSHPRGAKSETKVAVYEEKRQRFKTEDATVEVTVKLKKRNDKSKGLKHRVDQIQHAENIVHRAGSWGDLLMRKKLTDSQNSINKSGDQGAPRKYNDGDSQDEVRLIAKVSDRKPSYHKRRSRHDKVPSDYCKEGHCGRDCTDKSKKINGVLNVQVPASQNSQTKCCDACTCFAVHHVKDQESQTSVLPQPESLITKKLTTPPQRERQVYNRISIVQEHIKPQVSHSVPDKPGSRRQSTNRRSEVVTMKRFEHAEVQTKEKELSKVTQEVEDIEHMNLLQDLQKLSELEKENLLLKQDTSKLMQQVEKSKTERQEYITTIKELYELAEVLRHENVILIGTHEEHLTLQDKLSEALGENQVLKQHLNELSTRISQTEVDKSKENEIRDFWKVRDVLKEVKTVISQEINGLQHDNGRNSPSQIDDSDILELFGRTKDNRDMNETSVQCDDEIQKILNVSREIADRSDVRSSTQYLDVDGEVPGSGRNYVPSPDSDPSSL